MIKVYLLWFLVAIYFKTKVVVLPEFIEFFLLALLSFWSAKWFVLEVMNDGRV